jgi:hypothetical protein
MPNPKDELKAHEDRAKRARSNIAKFKRLMAHNALVLKLEQQRAARVKKKIANTGERSAAVKWALSTVGVVESPPFSNQGPRISKWASLCGYPGGGVPWCQVFCATSAYVGSSHRINPADVGGYTVSVVDRATRHAKMGGVDGWKKIKLSECKPGDWVYFKFSPGGDSVQHVGIFLKSNGSSVTCVEGNTARGNGGDQANGGGVFVRTRSLDVVAACVRVPYKD